jgi:hypothetical protein
MAKTHLFGMAIAAMLVGTLTSTSHAYLDPGTGSLILQVLLGGVAGVALAGKLYWQKLMSLFGRQDPEPSIARADDPDQVDARRR